MLRSFALTSALTVALALPASAEQLTEQDAHRIANSLVDSVIKTEQARDAAAVAALYTEDAVRIIHGNMERGRAVIEKGLAESLPNWDEDSGGTVDQVRILGNDAIVAIASWSGTWHGADAPSHITGRAAYDCVRVGDTWKIAVHLISPAPPK